MKEKISVKTLYLLGIITIGLIGLGLGSTYAMFTASAEIDNPISLNANLNSEDDIIETIELELEPNDIRVAVINLNNTSNTTLNYASFYITKSNDIEVGVTHNFTDTAVPTGSIENGTTKKVYIQIKNNGSNYVVGFPNSSLSKVLNILEENRINYIVIEDNCVIDKYKTNKNRYSEYIVDLTKLIYINMKIESIYKKLQNNILNNNIEKILLEIEELL